MQMESMTLLVTGDNGNGFVTSFGITSLFIVFYLSYLGPFQLDVLRVTARVQLDRARVSKYLPFDSGLYGRPGRL